MADVYVRVDDFIELVKAKQWSHPDQISLFDAPAPPKVKTPKIGIAPPHGLTYQHPSLDFSTPDPDFERQHPRGAGGKFADKPGTADVSQPTAEKKPGKPKPGKTTASDYLNGKINFGGEMLPRHEVIRQLREDGASDAQVDRYIQGANLSSKVSSTDSHENAPGAIQTSPDTKKSETKRHGADSGQSFDSEGSSGTGSEKPGGMTVVEHFHSKLQKPVWVAQLPGRVEREEYDRLAAAAKEKGGWYSRSWQGSPAGFTFKSKAAAEEFAGQPSGSPAEEKPEPKAAAPEPKAAAPDTPELAALRAMPRFPDFTPGDVVTLEGGRRRYLVMDRSHTEGGPSHFNLQALSGGDRGSGPVGVQADGMELSPNQAIEFTGLYGRKRQRDAVGVAQRRWSTNQYPEYSLPLRRAIEKAPLVSDTPEEHAAKVAAVKQKARDNFRAARLASEREDAAKQSKQQEFERKGREDAGRNASSLREGAEKLEDQGNESLGRDRQANTHRRADMAQNAQDEARRLIAVAGTMRRVADTIEAGDAPLLAHVKNRAQVEALLGLLHSGKSYNSQQPGGEKWEDAARRPYNERDVSFARYPWPRVTGYTVRDTIAKLQETRGGKKLASELQGMYRGTTEHVSFTWSRGLELCSKIAAVLGKDAPKELTEGLRDCNRIRNLGIETPDQLTDALMQFLPCVSAKQREDPIKAAERNLVGTKIPGYFPTPKALVERMLDEADIRPGMSVLEPSAGKGNIADAAKERGADVTTIEPHSTLREILQAKGHKDAGRDFLEHSGQYDRVVLNPPFENGQDIQHVQHAYEQLKPGGKLVAIMSSGPFFREDSKAKGFRSWLEQHDGMSEKLPDGSFAGKDSERSTGVATRLVTIEKPDAVESPAVQDAGSVPLDTVVVPWKPARAGNPRPALQRLSATSLKGDDPVFTHQGDLQQLNMTANITAFGTPPPEWAKKKWAAFEAAKAAGYERKRFDTSSRGEVTALVKDGHILTEKGAYALVDGGNKPEAAAPANTPEVTPEEPQKPRTLADALRDSAAHFRTLSEKHGADTMRKNYESNPVGDMGGIRSHSQKRKDRGFESMLASARKSSESRDMATVLNNMADNHDQHLRMMYRGKEILDSGMLNGEPLTREQRKRVAQEIHRHEVQLGYIERSAEATKARRYHDGPPRLETASIVPKNARPEQSLEVIAEKRAKAARAIKDLDLPGIEADNARIDQESAQSPGWRERADAQYKRSRAAWGAAEKHLRTLGIKDPAIFIEDHGIAGIHRVADEHLPKLEKALSGLWILDDLAA